ncbi:hypothetical protein Mgra_00007903, partial [Meloidogyne graminicola]
QILFKKQLNNEYRHGINICILKKQNNLLDNVLNIFRGQNQVKLLAIEHLVLEVVGPKLFPAQKPQLYIFTTIQLPNLLYLFFYFLTLLIL